MGIVEISSSLMHVQNFPSRERERERDGGDGIATAVLLVIVGSLSMASGKLYFAERDREIIGKSKWDIWACSHFFPFSATDKIAEELA